MATFATLAGARIALLQHVLTAVLNAENAVLVPILKGLMLMFIARQCLLFEMGRLHISQFLDQSIRALIVIFLVAHAPNYNQYIAQKIFTNVPQALTTISTSSYVGNTANQAWATQLDTISAGGEVITANVVKQVTFNPMTWIPAIASAVVDEPAFQLILWLIFTIGILGMGLLCIALCIGPPFLLFELFERTRGFVDQWIAKLVGFTAAGFATSIVMAMQLQSLADTLVLAKGVTDIYQAAAAFTTVLGDSLQDVVLLALCPLAFGFGSGMAAALSMPSMLALSRTFTLASRAAKAAGKGVEAGVRAGGRAAARAIA